MAKVKYICGSCNSEINDSDKFCTGCGAGLKPISDAKKKALKIAGKGTAIIQVNEKDVDALFKLLRKSGVGVMEMAADVVDDIPVEMTDEEFDAAYDALEIIADADVKTKLRGSSIPQAMAKLKKALETSLFMREQMKKTKEDLKGDPSNKDFLIKSLKGYKERMKDADMLTNMWIDAIKQALKVK